MTAALKPNFLLIGAPKAATTSLCAMLARHPDVYVVEGKETHFFSHDRVYARGWDWYRSKFSGHAGQSAVGDGSASYSMTAAFPNVVPRITRALPGVRIIYSVRHPLERMESAYIERMTTSGSRADFTSINDAVRRQPRIVDSSRYWKHISAYRRQIPDDRIRIVWFEEYVADPDAVLAGLFAFLGVDPDVRIPDSRTPLASRADRLVRARAQGRHITPDTTWTPETRQWVIDQIGADTASFLQWCGRPADYWCLGPPAEPEDPT